jgi:hypothetical protein
MRPFEKLSYDSKERNRNHRRVQHNRRSILSSTARPQQEKPKQKGDTRNNDNHGGVLVAATPPDEENGKKVANKQIPPSYSVQYVPCWDDGRQSRFASVSQDDSDFVLFPALKPAQRNILRFDVVTRNLSIRTTKDD